MGGTASTQTLTQTKIYVLTLFMPDDNRQDPLSAIADNAPEQTVTNRQAQAAQRYVHVLEELIDIGTELAGMVLQQARKQVEASNAIDALGQDDQGFNVRIIPTPALTPDPIGAFERITRAIRRTMTLANKLNEPPKAPAAPVFQDRGAADRAAARKRIIRDVEDTIQRTTKDDEAERIHAEFLERLDGPDLDDDIADRPVDEIVADICRDLGIANYPGAHPWKRRTPADIAILAARAAKPTEADPSASPHPNVAASKIFVMRRPDIPLRRKTPRRE